MNATVPNLTLSIVVPIYNVEAYLEQCLQTLIELSAIGHYEVIMVDDCGNDSSMVIAENYLRSYPSIFKLVKHNKNQGIAASRNSGLAEAASPKVKTKILFSSLGTRAFIILFLLHINYQPFTWSNARPLVHAT